MPRDVGGNCGDFGRFELENDRFWWCLTGRNFSLLEATEEVATKFVDMFARMLGNAWFRAKRSVIFRSPSLI